MRRGSFRQDGLPHELIVLSDLSRTLREEERQAWQRLIRVLGHELNNSLAPIQSVAQSLERGLHTAMQSPELHDGPAAPLLDDFRQGLGIIRSRTEALGRFMAAYAKLARLPQPKLSSINAGEWIGRAVKLETRLKVVLLPGPQVTISADADQLEQLLINLIRNATDAVLEASGGVQVGWSRQGGQFDFRSSTTARAYRTPLIFSSPFSLPSRAAPVSVWCSAGKSPKPTAASSH